MALRCFTAAGSVGGSQRNVVDAGDGRTETDTCAFALHGRLWTNERPAAMFSTVERLVGQEYFVALHYYGRFDVEGGLGATGVTLTVCVVVAFWPSAFVTVSCT